MQMRDLAHEGEAQPDAFPFRAGRGSE